MDYFDDFATIYEFKTDDHRNVLKQTIKGQGVAEISATFGLSKRRVHRCLQEIRYRMGVKDKRMLRYRFDVFIEKSHVKNNG